MRRRAMNISVSRSLMGGVARPVNENNRCFTLVFILRLVRFSLPLLREDGRLSGKNKSKNFAFHLSLR